MTSPVTRRRFLRQSSAALAAPLFVPGAALGLAGRPAASERITVGFVGAGAMGNFLLDQFLALPDAMVTAVCDVQRDARERTSKRADHHYAGVLGPNAYRGCKAYEDFRDLCADPGVDAVVVVVPEHWHAIPTITAARAGKDVFCEKPLTLTLEEGRAVVSAVERHGRVFQHGTQQRCFGDFARAVELVQNGRIGDLQRIEIGVPPGRFTGNHPEQPVPDGFHYDLWLGPAPDAPYTPARCHENVRDWMSILDYSGGQPTNWGVHHFDIAHWAMGVNHGANMEVEATGKYPRDGLWNAVLTWKATCRYENGVEVVFTDNLHQRDGIALIGSEGRIFVDRNVIEAEPAGILDSVIGPDEVRVHTAPDHYQNFLDCIKSRARTVCPSEMAHRSTTAGLVINIALQLGRKVRWDARREAFVDDPAADRLRSRAMRSPWRL